MPVSTRTLILLGGLALLGACGGGKTDHNDMAALDAKLTNAAEVPGNAVSGADAPAESTPQAEAARIAGGRIERAPEPTVTDDAPARPGTLGALAAQQGKGGGGCSRQVRYGPEWADKLPAPFRLYPQAKLAEAAGVSNGRCEIAVASFTTSVPVDQVIDYYYTQARRAGYDAEHLLCRGEHRLGGVHGKDGTAYLIFARQNEKGESEVDILANL